MSDNGSLPDAGQPVIGPLEDATLTELDAKRSWVQSCIEAGSAPDYADNWQTKLEVIISIAEHLDETATAAWQALGVVFGDAISQFTELEWVEYTDDAGPDAAILINEADATVMFPMTMLSKRVERGEKLNRAAIIGLFEGVTTTALQRAGRPNLA